MAIFDIFQEIAGSNGGACITFEGRINPQDSSSYWIAQTDSGWNVRGMVSQYQISQLTSMFQILSSKSQPWALSQTIASRRHRVHHVFDLAPQGGSCKHLAQYCLTLARQTSN